MSYSPVACMQPCLKPAGTEKPSGGEDALPRSLDIEGAIARDVVNEATASDVVGVGMFSHPMFLHLPAY